MAETVIRPAGLVQDGDEISLNHGPDQYSDWDGAAIVLEKTLGEDGRVTLLISVDAEELVRTKPRPREQTQPSTPFEDLGPRPGDSADSRGGSYA